MSKYDGLRKEISRLKAGTIGEVLPYMAMIDKVRDGYQLSIGFWDSKKGSSKKPTPTKFYKFKEQVEAERYLVKYLQDNKPLKPFILFSNEEDIYKGISEYAGLLHCVHCGELYYSNVDRGRRFYNCSTKKHSGTIVCNNPNISEVKLDKAVTRVDLYMNEWKGIIKYKEMLKELEQMIMKQFSSDDTEKVSALSTQLKELETKKDRYVEMYSDALISKQEMTAKVEPINKVIEDLEYSITISSKHNTELSDDVLKILEAQTFLDNEDKRLKKEFTENIKTHDRSYFLKEIERIIIKEDGKVDIVYKITARLENLFSKYQKLYDELKKKQNTA